MDLEAMIAKEGDCRYEDELLHQGWVGEDRLS